ncbi:MAG: ATP-binding protein, partial [Clostridia bacterium]
MNNIERAKLNILQRRQLAEKVSSDNLATLLAFADFKNIYREKRSLEIKFAKENFGGIDSAETAKQIKKLNIELLAIIHSHKMTAEDIAPKYFCDKCLDLGFVGKEQCVCLKNEIRQLLISDAQIKNANFVFENSTETDVNNLKAYSFAEQFCNNFNKSKINNFLILGKNGAGKSFMASCIANRLIEQQISVMFVTAYNLNNIFLKSHLSPYNEKLADIDSIIDVDFLIIDDLGSETV